MADPDEFGYRIVEEIVNPTGYRITEVRFTVEEHVRGVWWVVVRSRARGVSDRNNLLRKMMNFYEMFCTFKVPEEQAQPLGVHRNLIRSTLRRPDDAV